MKRTLSNFVTSLLVFAGLLSPACKKSFNEFEKGTEYPKVTDLDPGRLIVQFDKAGGGSIVVHNPIIGQQRDVCISILDESGKVLRTTTFGASRNEYISQAIMDAEGNIYVVGGTTSPELRLDPLKYERDAGDGYVAKVDKEGNLLWQHGYCNVNSLQKGVWEDEFATISLVNGKLYCVGFTENELPVLPTGTISNYDTWMVVFDVNGNFLKEMILPSIYKGASILNFGGGTWMDAIKLTDNNLVLRYVYMDYLSQGREMDTTAMMFKFNTTTDQIMWIQYFPRLSPYGDILHIGQLSNGNIVGFDSYFNSINILDQHTGSPISHTVIGNSTNSPTSVIYSTRFKGDNFRIGENYYVVGWMNIGGGTTDMKPWIIKLDKQGRMLYSKVLPLDVARLYWIREGSQHNLELTGAISVFGTLLEKVFTVGITPDGEFIKANND